MSDQQGQVDPQLYYAMMRQRQQEQDSLRFQLDPSLELENFKNNLMGFVYDESTDTFKLDPDKKSLINQQGANMVLTFANPRLSKLTSLSNMEDEAILKRAMIFEEDMEWALARHQHEFAIPSFPIMSLISSTVGDLNFMTSMRSIKGWEGDGIRKQQSIVESRETITDNRNKGMNLPFKNMFNKN